MNHVNQSLQFVKNMIDNVRLKIEDVEHELKDNNYSKEGIEMTKKEKRDLERELEILREVREQLEKGSSELYKRSKE